MANQKKNSRKSSKTASDLTKNFLVRLLDDEVIKLVDNALKDNVYPNRNYLVNECIRGWLIHIDKKNNPEKTLDELFRYEIDKMLRPINNKLFQIKQALLVNTAVQKFDDKALGLIINLLSNAFSQEEYLAALPQAEIDRGAYDTLPERLEEEKINEIKSILELNQIL